MSNYPRILLQTDRFRIVDTGKEKLVEKPDGCDALGVERWRDVRFADAETNSKMLRDWVFAHLLTCPALKKESE